MAVACWRVSVSVAVVAVWCRLSSTALPGRGGWRGCVDKAPFIDPHQSVTDRSPEPRAAGAACGWDDRIGEGGDSWFVVRGKEGKGREGKGGESVVSVCASLWLPCVPGRLLS